MAIFSIFIIVIALSHLGAQSHTSTQAVIENVRRYLLSSRTLSIKEEDAQWLSNSGKIGVGYDLMTGAPVCYTGQCQMEGFRQPLFKLNMTKRTTGSCTNKIIPQNVNLDCLPSSQITANTESISTIDQLMESTKRGIEVSASVGFFGNSFSYTRSHETRSMIDTIIQSNSTVYFTRATVTWVRLSTFSPLLELSDQFRYVIDHMPCCNESEELDQYVREFIFEFFGVAYIKDLLLGGIAQQKIVISEENRKNLQQNGFTNMDQVELKVAAAGIFSASTKFSMTEQLDRTKQSTFQKFSQQNSITTLGGSTSMQSIEEWSKTISSNPTIVKFSVTPIIDLLTARRFPTDENIAIKRDLIRRAQNRYMGNQLFCYNNCSKNGQCIATKYFGFGQCHCNKEWGGVDCSVPLNDSTGNQIPLHRYNNAGTYFYTAQTAENGTNTTRTLAMNGWTYEGIACNLFTTQQVNTVPFYRYSKIINYPSYSRRCHFYTANWNEIGTNIIGMDVDGWKLEEIVGYAYTTRQPGTCPLYRYYRAHGHFYTVNPCEIGVVGVGQFGSHGFKYEGVAVFVPTNFRCETAIC